MNKWLPIVFSSLFLLNACGGGSEKGGGVDKKNESTVTSAHRLLTQATFGATEAEIDRVVSMGEKAWIDEQFTKHSAYVSDSDGHKTHLERTIEIAELVEPSVTWSKDGIFGTGGGPIWHLRANQASAWLENALGHPTNTMHGSDQLRQRVAYALSQLMVVSMKDPRLYLRGESVAYYNDILAKNAFGSFRDLLGEVTRSATMGVYLTYQGNQKANPEKSTRPDENFAREVIQLFTVGLYELNIDGSANRDGNPNTYPDAGIHQVPTYTQEDVVELAKVMTGWDVKSNKYHFGYTSMGTGEYAAPMEFFPEYHEDEAAEGGDGYVTVLGNTFALNSGADGSGLDAALDVLFNHPNVAPFVSKHLITNLVTSNPSSAYVARVAKVFNDDGKGHRGYMKAVVRAVLTDPEARDRSQQGEGFGKVKEPFLVFTQLLRAFDVKPLEGWTGPAEPIRGDGSKSTVHGIYSYDSPGVHFGQGPLRSKSVFNHYMPDFVPNERYFSDNNLVAPEAQIQTDGNIINVHNTLANYLTEFERNKITKVRNKTMAEFSKRFQLYSSHGMVINYDRELAVFEEALDGDTDGDFKNMSNALDKINAVDALIAHLDKKMLGNTMSDEVREALRYYLVNSSNFSSSKKFDAALHLISDAVRFIATSSAYMVQQ
ncbi:MAG: DUF1800 domain-containing protein [Cocleimonas sp.]|nr:DUF1800 domain-containing protein [Cocleimonas sp.]